MERRAHSDSLDQGWHIQIMLEIGASSRKAIPKDVIAARGNTQETNSCLSDDSGQERQVPYLHEAHTQGKLESSSKSDATLSDVAEETGKPRNPADTALTNGFQHCRDIQKTRLRIVNDGKGKILRSNLAYINEDGCSIAERPCELTENLRPDQKYNGPTDVLCAWQVDESTPDEIGEELCRLQAQLRCLMESTLPTARFLEGQLTSERKAKEVDPAKQEEEERRQQSLREYMLMMEEHRKAVEEYRRQVEEDMEANCVVCFDGDPHGRNQIVFCECCNIPVHQECYGVPELPPGDWFCRPCYAHLHDKIPAITEKCQADRESNFKEIVERDSELREVHLSKPQPICLLCNVKGGAHLWAPKEQAWIHVNCAKWGDLKMDPVTFEVSGVEDCLKRNAELQCCICDAMGGALINCEAERCLKYFHFFCARNKQWDLFQPVAGDTWFQPRSKDKNDLPPATMLTRETRANKERGANWTGFCSVHSVKDTAIVQRVIRAVDSQRVPGTWRERNGAEWETWLNCHVCKIRKPVTTQCKVGQRFSKKAGTNAPCEISYCDRCVNIQGDTFENVQANHFWECYACVGNCRCAACRRSRERQPAKPNETIVTSNKPKKKVEVPKPKTPKPSAVMEKTRELPKRLRKKAYGTDEDNCFEDPLMFKPTVQYNPPAPVENAVQQSQQSPRPLKLKIPPRVLLTNLAKRQKSKGTLPAHELLGISCKAIVVKCPATEPVPDVANKNSTLKENIKKDNARRTKQASCIIVSLSPIP